jgi:hypothetical protein
MATRPRRIFLDANVVIRAGRPPGTPLIPRITDLVDAGYVKVVTTDLTKMEIAKKHAGNDFDLMGDLTKRRIRDLADEILGVKLPALSRADLHRKATRQIPSVGGANVQVPPGGDAFDRQRQAVGRFRGLRPKDRAVQ